MHVNVQREGNSRGRGGQKINRAEEEEKDSLLIYLHLLALEPL